MLGYSILSAAIDKSAHLELTNLSRLHFQIFLDFSEQSVPHRFFEFVKDFFIEDTHASLGHVQLALYLGHYAFDRLFDSYDYQLF